MPILKPVIADDPLAQLAWNASVAILALEKLTENEPLTGEQRTSLVDVLDFAESISKASQRKPDELLSSEEDVTMSSVLASFSLAADRGAESAEAFLDHLSNTKVDIRAVLEKADTHPPVDVSLLEKAQDGCLEILKTANALRPGSEQPPYVEF